MNFFKFKFFCASFVLTSITAPYNVLAQAPIDQKLMVEVEPINFPDVPKKIYVDIDTTMLEIFPLGEKTDIYLISLEDVLVGSEMELLKKHGKKAAEAEYLLGLVSNNKIDLGKNMKVVTICDTCFFKDIFGNAGHLAFNKKGKLQTLGVANMKPEEDLYWGKGVFLLAREHEEEVAQ
jgi:hypothetical protein